MKSHPASFPFVACAFVSHPRTHCQIQDHKNLPLCFFQGILGFSLLHLVFDSLQVTTCVKTVRWGVNFPLCMWISSCPNTICWRDHPSHRMDWASCQKPTGHRCEGLFLGSLFYPLISVSILMSEHTILIAEAL